MKDFLDRIKKEEFIKESQMRVARLAAFQPGGCVERLLTEWKDWDVSDDIPNRLAKVIQELEALLPPKKEGENE